MTDTTPEPEPTFTTRSGMIAVAGRANVGKSSLVNALVQDKVSIVSPVAQTTRNTIRAMLNEERGQLVFIDTPGIHKARSPLGKRINAAARTATEGVDVLLFVVDATEAPRIEDDGWMRRIVGRELPVIWVFNKADEPLTHREAFLDLWREITAEAGVTLEPEIFETSATSGKGVKILRDALFEKVPLGPPLFDTDLLTDFPRRWAIADLIREKWFAHLHDELPHSMDVCVNDLKEVNNRLRVEALVYVERPSQKGIVIGRKGRLLRQVKDAATKEIAELYEMDHVELDLFIKVEPGWRKNFWILRQMGYA